MAPKDVAVTEVLPGLNGELIAADELAAVSTAQDVLDVLGVTAEELGMSEMEWDTNPFEMVEKGQLLNTRLIIAQWKFIAGNFGEYVFVQAAAVLDNGSTWLVQFVDGSTGIYEQLRSLTSKRLQSDDPKIRAMSQKGALVRGGLTKSEYDVEVDGKTTHGVTFYLSNSKKAA